MEAQNPRSGRSLTWTLVRTGMEAHFFSGHSMRGNSYTSNRRRSWGDVLQFLQKNTPMSYGPPSMLYLLKVHISLIRYSQGQPLHIYFWGPFIYKTFGNQWKENNIQYCSSFQSLWIYEKYYLPIHQLPSVWVFVLLMFTINCLFTDYLGGYCLRNTFGSVQLQLWNLITFIPYVYFLWYSMLKWFREVINNIAFWVYNHENV